MTCAICGKEFKKNEEATVREAWLKAGGFGSIPDHAVVHPACDARETNDLNTGKIKLADIYEKK